MELHQHLGAAIGKVELAMANSQHPAAVGDFAARLLATFDSISGYTILAIAAACAVVLELPSPLIGIDLGPVRTGIYGALIAAVGILAICLVVAKILRAAHEALSTRFENGRGSGIGWTLEAALEVIEDKKSAGLDLIIRRCSIGIARHACIGVVAVNKNPVKIGVGKPL